MVYQSGDFSESGENDQKNGENAWTEEAVNFLNGVFRCVFSVFGECGASGVSGVRDRAQKWWKWRAGNPENPIFLVNLDVVPRTRAATTVSRRHTHQEGAFPPSDFSCGRRTEWQQ